MKKELEEQLIKNHSYLFSGIEIEKKARQEKKCFGPIAFGCEVDDGWYDNLNELCYEIEKIDINKAVRFTQIKEKFGGSRYYIGYSENPDETFSKQISDLEYKYEELTFHICEVCGAPGRLCVTKGRWFKTVCKEHRKLKNWGDYIQEFTPYNKFELEEEVIYGNPKRLFVILDSKFDTETDNWIYLIGDNWVKEEELISKPYNKFYKNGDVEFIDAPGIPIRIENDPTFDVETMTWSYIIAGEKVDEKMLKYYYKTETGNPE